MPARAVFVSESVGGFDVAVRRTKTGQLKVRFYELDLGLFELASAPLHQRPRLTPLHQIPHTKKRIA